MTFYIRQQLFGAVREESSSPYPPLPQLIKYNLMEETYGKRWNKRPQMYFLSNDCTAEYANANQLQQDHPCVIRLIRNNYLRKPAPRDLPYQLDKPTLIDPSDGQSQAILRLLRNQTNGFFIECGALDGEFLSNTLYMERSLNWTGILIEADQKAYSQLAGRNRKAYSLPICLSTKPYPVEVVFNASDWSGSFIVDEDSSKLQISEDNSNNANTGQSIYKVQCFPLYSILVAVGRTEIDFLGLDVEGSEYKILKTIPWHKVDFKTLSVEWNHVPEGEAAMTRLMEDNKFVKFGHIDMAYSREVVYVQDYLDDFRQFEFD
uniref:Methyltransferase FkbM domain-containing protein n=1 Tax=Daphnia galeata TaxID=27404 RepID=A0A8J2WHX3_9CRUS|nr:unnamed protein product [Daphnia galeata]